MKIVTSLSEIFSQNKYDTLAIDIYGVLHDGFQTYPHSSACLQGLLDSGIHTVLLSNSTRLQDALNVDLEKDFAISPDSYTEILSSGEMTKIFMQGIANHLNGGHQKAAACLATARVKGVESAVQPDDFSGRYLKTGKFYLLGDPSWQEPLYEHLAPTVTRTVDWDEMEFALLGKVCATEDSTIEMDPYDVEDVKAYYTPFLQHCLRRNIPIICANPDVQAPHGCHPDGTQRLVCCPGFVGEMYEAMGGMVLYFGKPYTSIYKYLLANKVSQKKDSRVLCIGDNVATDVMGAKRIGLDVVMILGGVHWQELGTMNDEELKQKVRQLCKQHGSEEPTYLMPLLRYL
ncbi:hypothetical protein DFQ28_010168 [Apophysomyces sp. BC1034]|nr:hypothetical protein DFQ30_007624 [Apophysomyces sp. BC1015]KAG0181696.1 hypothetical protein DFQ29_007476 [Apophysomyces sp. BC1021]KAG0184963.1 hypothetical protein DFQ28_010168 [Apophysomyces sp. BC1034]